MDLITYSSFGFYSEAKNYCVPFSEMQRQNPDKNENVFNMCDWFVNQPVESIHGNFLRRVFELVLSDVVFDGTKRSTLVTKWTDPESLEQIINFSPTDQPENEERLMTLIKHTIQYSVKSGHPYFVNQLFSGLDPYGFIGQLVTDALNSSVYTYEMAPVFSLMEKAVLKKMRNLIDWEDGDGIFCPGGSLANGIAINLGRFSLNNDVKKNGIFSSPPLVLYTSRDAHYSIKKMAAFLGIGENNVILIETDANGCLNVQHLEDSIKQSLDKGHVPFAVVATSGTTVVGAFDPLDPIADLCRDHGLWLHVDAAWGGSLLFSSLHRDKLRGIRRADSVTVNPHKLLSVPQQCSLLLTRHPGLLSQCHATHATYLFQPDKFYGSDLDCGDSHIQCGRRPDVFKFWLMWKAKGSVGFEKHVDTIMNVSDTFKNLVLERANFRLVYEPQFINVCFWYIPPSMIDIPFQELISVHKDKLHKVAPTIKERMIRKGSMMLSYQPLRNKPNFFRFVTQNSSFTIDDAKFVLDEIELLGFDL